MRQSKVQAATRVGGTDCKITENAARETGRRIGDGVKQVSQAVQS